MLSLPWLLFATSLIPVSAKADEAAYRHSASVAIGEESFLDVPALALTTGGQGTGLSRGLTDAAGYGPFRVVDEQRVEMLGSVESDTPAEFRRLLSHYPGIREIRMVECPGSDDDDANLELAAMVRRAGISTFVPANGSVRSGAVELFLAGRERRAEPGAEFAVHSWRDEDGMEAKDFAASDPVHRPYLDFYRAIGMTDQQARAFYALTNSVSFDDALYLQARDIARFVALN